MAWRLLMRRCPSRSMTLVGDVAQTGDLAGTPSWAQVLEPYVADRWRLARADRQLPHARPRSWTVAAEVLAAIDPPLRAAPVGARHRRAAVATRVPRSSWPPAGRDRGGRGGRGRRRPARRDRPGRPASPSWRAAALRRRAARAGPGRAGGRADRPAGQGAGVRLGLVVDPARIVAESPRGRSDLYVALTRATQRLGVLHAGRAAGRARTVAGGGVVSQDLWTGVDQYVVDHLVPTDEALEAALAATAEAGMPDIGVAPTDGKLLHLLARLRGARTILELGTLAGTARSGWPGRCRRRAGWSPWRPTRGTPKWPRPTWPGPGWPAWSSCASARRWRRCRS